MQSATTGLAFNSLMREFLLRADAVVRRPLSKASSSRFLDDSTSRCKRKESDSAFRDVEKISNVESASRVPGANRVSRLYRGQGDRAPLGVSAFVQRWRGAEKSDLKRTTTVRCGQVDNAQIIAVDLPSSLACGASYTGSITMKNTGNSVWVRALHEGGFKLAVVHDPAPFASSSRVWLPKGATVAPGQNYSFSFAMRFPSRPGNFPMSLRLVREGVAFFGPTVRRTIQVWC